MIIIEDIILASLKDEGKGLIELLMRIGAIPQQLKCQNCDSDMAVNIAYFITCFLKICSLFNNIPN